MTARFTRRAGLVAGAAFVATASVTGAGGLNQPVAPAYTGDCVNGGTTASDALWAGLPLLTRAGDTFGGRVAASLLSSLGLSELIARDAQQYESIALDLARAPQRLAEIRQQLVDARTRSALFDTRGFVRDFEDVLQAMMQRERAGLKPADFGP